MLSRATRLPNTYPVAARKKRQRDQQATIRGVPVFGRGQCPRRIRRSAKRHRQLAELQNPASGDNQCSKNRPSSAPALRNKPSPVSLLSQNAGGGRRSALSGRRPYDPVRIIMLSEHPDLPSLYGFGDIARAFIIPPRPRSYQGGFLQLVDRARTIIRDKRTSSLARCSRIFRLRVAEELQFAASKLRTRLTSWPHLKERLIMRKLAVCVKLDEITGRGVRYSPLKRKCRSSRSQPAFL